MEILKNIRLKVVDYANSNKQFILICSSNVEHRNQLNIWWTNSRKIDL